jgi:hypothetical protein
MAPCQRFALFFFLVCSPHPRADFFLTICDALHPEALLTKDPDFNLLLGFSYAGEDDWMPKLTVDQALADTPLTRRRRPRRAHVSTSVAVFARLVLETLSTFTQEGNWSVPYPPFYHTGPCFPGDGLDGLNRLKVIETFASFTELREAAKDLLLGRDTKARRDVQIFRQLLHLPPFATLQREPKLNFALACWLQDWEILFWQWQSQAACDFEMCRVPTRDDYVNEAKARNAPHPEFRQRCGREHPFINCSTSLNDAFNIWHVPPGPDWWQHRMCLDVAQPAGMHSAAQSVSLRWLLYHAAVQGKSQPNAN